MKKVIKLQNLDCASCAAKIERAVSKLEGVTAASVNFISQKMTLEAPDEQFEAVFAAARKAARKIESDLVFLRP